MSRPHPATRNASKGISFFARVAQSARQVEDSVMEHGKARTLFSKVFAFRRHPYFTIFVVAYAIFVDLYLYAVLVPVFPFSLRIRIGLKQNEVQQTVGQLLAVYAAGSLLAAFPIGWLSDRTPAARRQMYTAGLIFLLLSTIGLAYAQTLPLLMLARFVQGVSSATGLAMLSATVDSRLMGRTMGIVGATVSFSQLIAPIAGGSLYSAFGEPGVFRVCFGMLAFDILFRLLLPAEKPYALEADGEEDGEGEGEGDGEEEDEAELLLTTLSKNHRPRVVRLLMEPRILAATLTGFIEACIVGGPLDAVLPLHLEEIFGFDSLTSGAMFTAVAVPATVVGPLAGWWMDRSGPRIVALSGLIFTPIFSVFLAFPHGPAIPRNIALMAVLLVAEGAALSLLASPGNTEISLYLDTIPNPEKSRAQAYSLYGVAYSLGSLVGPLVSAALVDGIGWGWMTTIWGAVTLLCIPVVSRYMGKRQ